MTHRHYRKVLNKLLKANVIDNKYTPVMFFLGPGGVGKSTISALMAIKYALSEKKVLVATFDPSPRLKDILVHEKGFRDQRLKKSLDVVILDSREIFESLLQNVDSQIATAIKKNKLFKHLIERIQGVQEFSSLYFLSQHVSTQKYDLIIIDTPPLQNSLDFFSSPQKLKDLFESTIVKLFIGDFNKNWFEKIFKKTRNLAFSTLKKLTGIDFFEQLISFMKALEKLQPVILKTLDESQSILYAQSTSYSFVTSYEEQNLLNTETQMNLIKTNNIEFRSLYINKYEVYNEDEIKNLVDFAKNENKTELLNYLSYKNKVLKNKKTILKTISDTSMFAIYTLDQFIVGEMDEEELILKSRAIYELKS